MKTPILSKINEIKETEMKLPFEIDLDFINNERPLSYSSLKHFRKSPLHYVNYITGERKVTPAMIFGSLVDKMILTPDNIDDEVVIMPKLNLRTKAGKEEKEQILANNKGKLVVTEEDFDKALRCVKAVYNDADARSYLERLKSTQIKLDWVDKKSGLRNIGWVDGEGYWEDPDYFIMDLKTTADASKQGFMRQAYNLDYHLQAGGYTLGYKKKFFRFPDYINIVIETTEPFAVNVFRADSKYIELAQKDYLDTLMAFRYAIDNKEFTKGYAFNRFMIPYDTLELPGYFRPYFG